MEFVKLAQQIIEEQLSPLELTEKQKKELIRELSNVLFYASCDWLLIQFNKEKK